MTSWMQLDDRDYVERAGTGSRLLAKRVDDATDPAKGIDKQHVEAHASPAPSRILGEQHLGGREEPLLLAS